MEPPREPGSAGKPIQLGGGRGRDNDTSKRSASVPGTMAALPSPSAAPFQPVDKAPAPKSAAARVVDVVVGLGQAKTGPAPAAGQTAGETGKGGKEAASEDDASPSYGPFGWRRAVSPAEQAVGYAVEVKNYAVDMLAAMPIGNGLGWFIGISVGLGLVVGVINSRRTPDYY